ESGHHFESQTIQRIQNVFGRTLSSANAANRFTEKSTSRSSALNISPKTELLSAACNHRMKAMVTINWNSGKRATRCIGASSDLIRAIGKILSKMKMSLYQSSVESLRHRDIGSQPIDRATGADHSENRAADVTIKIEQPEPISGPVHEPVLIGSTVGWTLDLRPN